MTTSTTGAVSSRAVASDATRWGQLIFGIICMVMIANLQYGWTLFVNPIDQKYHWGRAAIQVAFTIFVLTETWLVPIEGYLIDKFGPRIMISGSGVLVAIAWVINSVADSLFLLYVGAAIGGIGAGVIYGGSVGNALKWFPDRRGLAAGLTAAGFGAGSALTVIPIANMIQSSGYESAFLWFGLGQGIVVVLVALLLRAPEPGEVPVPLAPAVQQSRRDAGPAEVLRSAPFWVMYVMFVMVGTGGLMATAQLGPIASRRHRHLRAAAFRRSPVAVRSPVRSRVLRLGRDLLAVPGDLHRHLRPEVRDHELRPALHRKGHGFVAGAPRERAHHLDRQLDGGVRHRRGAQHHRRDNGARGVAAHAPAGDGARLSTAALAGAVPERANESCGPSGVALALGRGYSRWEITQLISSEANSGRSAALIASPSRQNSDTSASGVETVSR